MSAPIAYLFRSGITVREKPGEARAERRPSVNWLGYQFVMVSFCPTYVLAEVKTAVSNWSQRICGSVPEILYGR
jgi:hypothetical protein